MYDASGTLRGELAYWVRSRLGRDHCSLCDITHGTFREKPEWEGCRSQLPVPMETVHLDERDEPLERLTAGRTPCVVAEVDGRLEMLLGPQALAACDRSPEALVAAIARELDRRGWEPAPAAP